MEPAIPSMVCGLVVMNYPRVIIVTGEVRICFSIYKMSTEKEAEIKASESVRKVVDRNT